MKKIVIVSILLLMCIFTYGQEAMKNLDYIIVIDDEIAEGGPVRFTLHDKSGNIYKLHYYPGNLSISQSDYDKIMSDDSIKTLFLSFTYECYQGMTDNVYNYEIELSKGYFKKYYIILEIYNLDKKKYREAFKTFAKGKHLKYVHQIRSSDGSALIIRDK